MWMTSIRNLELYVYKSYIWREGTILNTFKIILSHYNCIPTVFPETYFKNTLDFQVGSSRISVFSFRGHTLGPGQATHL